MQTLGLDLADVWRGTLHPRRVWQLVEFLPSTSALMSELAGGLHFRDWCLQSQLTAHLINVVRNADANNIRANGGKAKAPKPIDVPTPGAEVKRPRIDITKHPLAQRIVRE